MNNSLDSIPNTTRRLVIQPPDVATAVLGALGTVKEVWELV